MDSVVRLFLQLRHKFFLVEHVFRIASEYVERVRQEFAENFPEGDV